MPGDRTRPGTCPAGAWRDVRDLRDGLAAGRRPVGCFGQSVDEGHRIHRALQSWLRCSLRDMDRLHRAVLRLDGAWPSGAGAHSQHLSSGLRPLCRQAGAENALYQEDKGLGKESGKEGRDTTGTRERRVHGTRRRGRETASSGLHLSGPRRRSPKARLRRLCPATGKQGVDEAGHLYGKGECAGGEWQACHPRDILRLFRFHGRRVCARGEQEKEVPGGKDSSRLSWHDSQRTERFHRSVPPFPTRECERGAGRRHHRQPPCLHLPTAHEQRGGRAGGKAAGA